MIRLDPVFLILPFTIVSNTTQSNLASVYPKWLSVTLPLGSICLGSIRGCFHLTGRFLENRYSSPVGIGYIPIKAAVGLDSVTVSNRIFPNRFINPIVGNLLEKVVPIVTHHIVAMVGWVDAVLEEVICEGAEIDSENRLAI